MSDRIERIVNAVLYEGYMLYPYRASSVKNRQRWNFGVVVPEFYREAVDPSERSVLRTECLLETRPDTTVSICVRFLQLVKREVTGDAPSIDPLEGCDETIERELALPELRPIGMNPFRMAIVIPESSSETTTNGQTIVRTSEAIRGEIVVESKCAGDDAVRLSISIANFTPVDAPAASRDDALRRSLLSAHAVLTAHDGAFVSLIDPGDRFAEAAEGCRQDGLYPVLAGEEGDRQTVLAAPIILYDHPQVAPESPDNLFDGTEIDEILTLRIQTLSDDEKREIRGADARTRQLLERADSLDRESLARLHGTLRREQPEGSAS
jgi:hypothetical protein